MSRQFMGDCTMVSEVVMVTVESTIIDTNNLESIIND